jgi:hypothetical protein
MPHYTIELIPWRGGQPSSGGVPDREERRFANLGDALQLAREMYRGAMRLRRGSASSMPQANSFTYGCP